MTLSLLDYFLLSQVFAFLLIFCRIGTAMMFLPAFGDSYVPARIRLIMALSISIVLVPIFGPLLPAVPNSATMLTLLLFTEITIGAMIGLCVRIIFSGMHVAGTLIATQASLAIASQIDFTIGSHSAVISNFLVLLTTVIFFQLDLHLLVLEGLYNTYMLFPAGKFPSTGDMSELTTRAVSAAFLIGTQLTAPFFVVGLITYLGGGILSRLMPQMQVLQITIAPQLMLAFTLLMAVLSSMIYLYDDYLHDAITTLFELENA